MEENTAPSQASNPPPPVSTPSQPALTVSDIPPTSPSPKSKKKLWIVLILIVLFLILVGGVSALFITHKSTTESSLPTLEPALQTPTPNPTIEVTGFKKFIQHTISFEYPDSWFAGEYFGEGNPDGGGAGINFSNYPLEDYTSNDKKDSLDLTYGTSSYINNDEYEQVKELTVGNSVKNGSCTRVREQDFQNDKEFIVYMDLCDSSVSKTYKYYAGKEGNFDITYYFTLTANTEDFLNENQFILDHAAKTFQILEE